MILPGEVFKVVGHALRTFERLGRPSWDFVIEGVRRLLLVGFSGARAGSLTDGAGSGPEAVLSIGVDLRSKQLDVTADLVGGKLAAVNQRVHLAIGHAQRMGGVPRA